MPCNILIIDDNEHILSSLSMLLKNEFTSVETTRNPNVIPSMITMNRFDVVLLDMNFSAGINTGNEGIYWLKKIKELRPEICVILITAYGDIDLAVKGMKNGATDFVLKPWNADELIEKLRHACSKSKKNKKSSQKVRSKSSVYQENTPLLNSSPPMQRIMETVQKVAGTDVNILILGENGTGKQLIAREIHKRSLRYTEAFVDVDLGSLSASLFETEIFGHVAGAYTDAKEARQGRFEMADKGTIFLDEIGNLELSLQSKLLTVIQSGKVSRVGSSVSIPLDVRIISATNMNLLQMVKEQKFREDLLYRINTIQIEIPPLRDRKEDIPALVEFYLRKFTSKYRKQNIRKINADALKALEDYYWPGNVRELLHNVEKAVILCEKDQVSLEDFNLQPVDSSPVEHNKSLNLSQLEKSAIKRALHKHNRNLTRTSEELGITRATLYAKIEKYGL